MKLKLVSALLLVTFGMAANAAVTPLTNGSFEVNDVGTSQYKYAPGYTANGLPWFASNVTATGWSFTGASGVASNNSAFSGTASAGTYYGFLQNVSSISQTFTASSSSTESLSFDLLARAYGGTAQVVTVSLAAQGGPTLYSWTGSGNSTSTYETISSVNPISLTSGTSYVLTLSGSTSGGDTTAFVDNVTLTPLAAVPEPETYAMMLAGLGFVGFIAKRRSTRG